MKYKWFGLEIELYGFKFNLVFSNSVLEGIEEIGMFKSITKYYKSVEEATTSLKKSDGIFCYFDKEDYFLISLEWNSTPDIICHECFHLVYSLMNIKDIKLSDDSEEAYAYALDYVVRKVLECQKIANKERRLINKKQK